MEEPVVIKFPTMKEYCYSEEKKNDKDELFTDSDTAAAEAAAQQFSDEENHSNNDNITDYDHDHDHDEEVDQRLKIRSRKAWSKIQEIFGKEDEEEEKEEAYHDHHQRPRKKQKYRCLSIIYRETQPTDHDKKKSSK